MAPAIQCSQSPDVLFIVASASYMRLSHEAADGGEHDNHCMWTAHCTSLFCNTSISTAALARLLLRDDGRCGHIDSILVLILGVLLLLILSLLLL